MKCPTHIRRVAVLYGGGYHREPGMTARLHANTIETAAAIFAAAHHAAAL